MSILHLDSKNFKKEVFDSELPVLVDFWAEWCLPCKALNPVLEELAAEYSGKIRIGKVNIDHNHKLAQEFGIMSIPTLIFFKDGRIQEQISGALNKAQLKKRIETIL
ncbi:MAG: thioredoxin [Candidatus Omnitrophica bacterium]|nr:thioredoxin [Candidatus Omnitrophota bacterium]MCM8770980.1 thioredoxin [Candidatus Omnitrophota bacterium]